MTEEEKEQHLSMIKYFWEEQGDFEGYIDSQGIRSFIQEEYPEVLKVWEDYKMSEKILTRVINDLY